MSPGYVLIYLGDDKTVLLVESYLEDGLEVDGEDVS